MKLLYLRNGPYKPQITCYNMQEIGLCKAFSDYGWNCDILYYSDEDRDEEIFYNEQKQTRVEILWRKGLKILRTGIYPSVLKKSLLSRYDLIITTEYSQIMSLLVCFFSKKVFLYTGPYYNLFKIPFLSSLYDRLFTKILNTRIKHIFCKSQLAFDYLNKKGFSGSNMSVLGVGLDVMRYHNAIEMTKSTEMLNKILIENDCILYVGSLDERKNFPFLLKVFAEFKNLRIGKHTKLILIGNGKEKYVNRFEKKMPTEVRDSIVHIRKIENAQLKYIYPFARCLLLPSKKEIFGMVLLESMFFGCIPVTTKNGGGRTLINNGDNGFVIDSFVVSDWILVLKKIFRNDFQRLEMAKSAQNTIRKNFLWKVLAKKILEKYDEQM